MTEDTVSGLRQRRAPEDDDPNQKTADVKPAEDQPLIEQIDEKLFKDEKPALRKEIESGSHWFVRIIFLRFLAFIYLVAFLVSYFQNKELLGENGLLPGYHIAKRTQNVENLLKSFLETPTLFYFVDLGPNGTNFDFWLDAFSLAGAAIASFIIIFGAANMFLCTALWLLYNTLVSVGQQWFSFGWESQILETGFLMIWSVPLFQIKQYPENFPTPWASIWGCRWLIFRLMLGAGLIKIRGDKCWRDLTCMDYFYQTQPNPNPISWLMHNMPQWWHIMETSVNHVVELGFPFLLFIPHRYAWRLNGVGQIFFQLILISTGNLSFLNWLTMAPAIMYFDDRFISFLFNARSKTHVQHLQAEGRKLKEEGKLRTNPIYMLLSLAVLSLVAFLSVPVIQNMMSQRQVMNTSFDRYRLVNTYGAFGHVTKDRTEIILEGTHNADPHQKDAKWEAYEFKCKPGDPYRAPCVISPYHYRLDWLMWFAAFQNYQSNPWLVHLVGKMLHNEEPLLKSLLAHNPFEGRNPPLFIRGRHMDYKFTTWTAKDSKAWWKRREIGEYLPIVNLHMIEPVYKQFKWKKIKSSKIEKQILTE